MTGMKIFLVVLVSIFTVRTCKAISISHYQELHTNLTRNITQSWPHNLTVDFLKLRLYHYTSKQSKTSHVIKVIKSPEDKLGDYGIRWKTQKSNRNGVNDQIHIFRLLKSRLRRDASQTTPNSISPLKDLDKFLGQKIRTLLTEASKNESLATNLFNLGQKSSVSGANIGWNDTTSESKVHNISQLQSKVAELITKLTIRVKVTTKPQNKKGNTTANYTEAEHPTTTGNTTTNYTEEDHPTTSTTSSTSLAPTTTVSPQPGDSSKCTYGWIKCKSFGTVDVVTASTIGSVLFCVIVVSIVTLCRGHEKNGKPTEELTTERLDANSQRLTNYYYDVDELSSNSHRKVMKIIEVNAQSKSEWMLMPVNV